MKAFNYLGAFSCLGLFMWEKIPIEMGLLFCITANIGFWGSIVFYNVFNRFRFKKLLVRLRGRSKIDLSQLVRAKMSCAGLVRPLVRALFQIALFSYRS